MWDWLDKVEGKKEGSSSANLEKEKKRQGYKTSEAKKKKIAGRMKSKDKAYGVFDKMAEKKHPGLKFHKDFKENA